MNKQEENIVDILTFDEIEEIVDLFISSIYHNNEKTVALIANKDLVRYAMGELVSHDSVNVKLVDMELDDIEYMISVDTFGNMVVKPIVIYNDIHINAIEYAYISMDGDVDQLTIDYLLDRDVPVVLFGCADEFDDGYTVEGEPASKEEFDRYITEHINIDDKNDKKKNSGELTSTTSTTYKINGQEVTKKEFDNKYEEFEEMYLDNIRDMLLNYCEFMDSVNEWRSRLIRW